jgi:catechol 2,3-dioxygenase-like lactoylglutathione lyase family enzyme
MTTSPATTATTALTPRPTPAVTGFNHVAVLTGDLDRFVEFYGDVLGLEVVLELRDEHRHAVCTVGAASFLHVFEVPGSPHAASPGGLYERGHLDHIAFSAPDAAAFEAIRARLVERGASDGSVREFEVGRSVGFRDPDGMDAEVVLMVQPDVGAALRGGLRLPGMT